MILDKFFYILIAVIYNIFVHSVASFMYKDLQFYEKHNNTSIFIFIMGIIGIIISFIVKENDKSKAGNIIYNGLFIGGLFLVFTILVVNWQYVGEEMKLVAVAGLFIALVMFLRYWFKDDNIDKIDKFESGVRNKNKLDLDDFKNKDRRNKKNPYVIDF